MMRTPIQIIQHSALNDLKTGRGTPSLELIPSQMPHLVSEDGESSHRAHGTF